MLIAQPSQPPAAIASIDPAAMTPYCGGISEDPAKLRRGLVTGSTYLKFLSSLPPACGDHCVSPYRIGVRPADMVALAQTNGRYVCAEHWPPHGPSPLIGGWLSRSRVHIIPNGRRTHPIPWWDGLWESPDAWISIKTSDGLIHASGQANWRGYRFGEFKATVRPVGDEVDVHGGGFDDCSIRLLAFGERIVAADNGKCGATNVTFRGFYVRKKRVRTG